MHVSSRVATRTLLAVALTVGLHSVAQASVISFQTRFSGSPSYSDAASLRSAVEALTGGPPTAGYCDAGPAAWSGLSNQTTCGGGLYDIAFAIGAAFNVAPEQAGAWNFRIGPDFGRGGALFIDGVAVDFRSTDMWWAGSYLDPTQILTATVALAPGNHALEAFGFEGCCDGAQQAQFLAPGARDFVIFSADDGQDPIQVPEPATGALATLALAAFGIVRGRARR